MAGGALAQLTASKAGSSGTVRNWHPKNLMVGGADVNAGEYYGGNSQRYFPSGSDKLKVPCHAYGQGRASSFGSVHNDWKSAGPNLAPYPGSSGMMTGGAKRKSGKQSKRANSKKVVKVRKTKKVSKRGGGWDILTLQYKSGVTNNNDSKSVSVSLTDKTIPKLNTLKDKFLKEMTRLKDIHKRGNTYTYGIQNTIDADFKDVQTKYRACVELLQQINNQSNKQSNNSALKYTFDDIKLYDLFKKELESI
jgi:hypothetical protein